MSNLTRYNPARDLMSMNNMLDRFFNDAFFPMRDGGFGSPNVDVIENNDNIVVKAELPGFKPENVDLRVEGNLLVMRGEGSEETQKNEGQYHLHERHQASFVRSIPLPTGVDANKANAEFENGVLTLTLPKNEESKPKRITVNAKK